MSDTSSSNPTTSMAYTSPPNAVQLSTPGSGLAPQPNTIDNIPVNRPNTESLRKLNESMSQLRQVLPSEQFQDVLDQINELAKIIKAQNEELEQNRKMLENFTSHIDYYQRELLHKNHAAKTRVSDLETQQKEIAQKANHMFNNNTMLQNHVRDLKVENDQLKRQMSVRSGSEREHELLRQLQEAKERENELLRKLQNAKNEKERLQNDMEANEDLVASMTDQNNMLEQESTFNKQKYDELLGEFNIAKTSQLMVQPGPSKQEFDDMKNKMLELESKCGNMTDQLEVYKHTAETYKADFLDERRCREREHAISESLKDEVRTRKSEIEKLKSEVSRLKSGGLASQNQFQGSNAFQMSSAFPAPNPYQPANAYGYDANHYSRNTGSPTTLEYTRSSDSANDMPVKYCPMCNYQAKSLTDLQTHTQTCPRMS